MQPAEKQIFGWLSDEAGGGVWVLRIPMASWRRGDDDDFWHTQAGFEAMLEFLAEGGRESERMGLLAMKIGEQKDMDGFVIF